VACCRQSHTAQLWPWATGYARRMRTSGRRGLDALGGRHVNHARVRRSEGPSVLAYAFPVSGLARTQCERAGTVLDECDLGVSDKWCVSACRATCSLRTYFIRRTWTPCGTRRAQYARRLVHLRHGRRRRPTHEHRRFGGRNRSGRGHGRLIRVGFGTRRMSRTRRIRPWRDIPAARPWTTCLTQRQDRSIWRPAAFIQRAELWNLCRTNTIDMMVFDSTTAPHISAVAPRTE